MRGERMALIKCRSCGEEISDTSKKCIHCGADIILEVECSECHKMYDNTTNICPYCGKKNTSNVSAGVNDIKKNIKKLFSKNRKKFVLFGFLALIVLIVAIVLRLVIPPMLITVEDYLETGDYLNAYKKAKNEEERNKVLLENLIAKISYEISESLKDPDSFKLSHVYFNNEDELVFEIIGKNSYGGNVTNYYDYRYDNDEKEYTLYVYLSSLDEENYYSWDSYDEKLEIIIKNAIRETIIELMNSEESKINYETIDRVNNLFKQKKLRDVQLIPYIKSFYPDDNYA